MNLFRRYPNFFLFSLALTLSGIGSSLTGVAIYELMRMQGLPEESFALVFGLTFLPALFASELGKRLANRVRFSSVFVYFNILGVIICALNLWNLSQQAPWIYYATILFGGTINGVYFPLYQILLKRTIHERDLPSFAVYETFVFGLQFILGELLGTLLFSVLTPARYFQVDILTFTICSAFIIGLARSGKLSFAPLTTKVRNDEKTIPAIRWTKPKRIAFSINLSLAAVAAPLMAIMLAHLSKLPALAVGALSMSPVLLGLSSRSLGQLVGPLLGGYLGLEKAAKHRWALELCTGLFLLAYALFFHLPTIEGKIACVFVAHIFSNIVFAIGFYQFNKEFELEEFAVVSTRNYQLITLIMILSAAWAGAVQSIAGEKTVLTMVLVIFLLTALIRSRALNHPTKA